MESKEMGSFEQTLASLLVLFCRLNNISETRTNTSVCF